MGMAIEPSCAEMLDKKLSNNHTLINRNEENTMKESNPPKPILAKTILVSITLLIDGIGIAGLAAFFLLLMYMVDPPYSSGSNAKFENIRSGQFVLLAGLGILLIYLLVAIFWRMGKRFGKYAAAGLSIFSICILAVLIITLPIISLGFEGVFLIFLILLLLVLVGLNILSLRIIFSRDKPAILDKSGLPAL